MENKETKSVLTRKDILKAWATWVGTCELSNSYERLQSLAFVGCLTPILKKLYKKKEDLRNALKRHLTFFNTEGIWGSLVHGITIAMEEEKARGEDISDEMITGIKTGFMGPLAGIGDTIDWGTIRPIIIGLFLPLAAKGSWIAGMGPFIISSAITTSISYYLWNLGYKLGKQSILKVLKGGKIQQFITGAGVLGLFMMGVLSSQFVKLSPKLKYIINGKEVTMQSQLDTILPGILPLSAIFLIYYLLKNKKMKYTTILIGVLAFSLIFAYLKVF